MMDGHARPDLRAFGSAVVNTGSAAAKTAR